MFLAAAAVLSVIVLAALSAALPSALLPGNTAYAQANSAPQFPASETGTRTVDENTPWYQNIGDPVTATDPDADELTYSLKNARTSPFTIDTFSGQLQTGASLDYETESSYTVKVIATDPSGETAWTTVTINVNNVEEPGKVSLSWKQPQVNTPLEATLTDPDGVAGTPTWTWARADAKRGAYTDINGAMVAELHAGCRRRRVLPAGHGHLQRRARAGQDPAGGITPSRCGRRRRTTARRSSQGIPVVVIVARGGMALPQIFACLSG